MSCYKCGQQLPREANFCYKCGTATFIDVSEETTEAPPPGSEYSALPQEQIAEITSSLQTYRQEHAEFIELFNDLSAPLVEAAFPVAEPRELLEAETMAWVQGTGKDVALHPFKEMFAVADTSWYAHFTALWLQRSEDWLREYYLKDFERILHKNEKITGYFGIVAAQLGATDLAERFINMLVNYKGAHSELTPFDAGIIALQLPTLTKAKLLLRHFETTRHYVAAVYIAAEIGDAEAVDRLLEQIIAHGIRPTNRNHLYHIVGCLMLAVPYNPVLGRKVVQMVEGIRGVSYMRDDVEYLAFAGNLAAVLGETTYARQAIAGCLDKKKYLLAGKIAALLGETILTAIMLAKEYQVRKDSKPPDDMGNLSRTQVGNILGTLAKHHPHAVARIWKVLEHHDPTRYRYIAGVILAHFTCESPFL